MSRKNIYWLGTCFFSVVIVFTFVYYKSYQNSIKHDNAFQTNEQAYNSDKEGDQIEENVVNKASAIKNRITDTTTICWEYYYVKKDITRKKSTLAPDYLIGLTRKETIEYVEEYMKNISDNEKEEGLFAYEVVSFSAEKVVLRKSFEEENTTISYYIGLRDNAIVVYYEDKKTIYEETGILVDTLPEDERKRLEVGIEVEGEEELFGILEGYSS